MGIMTKPVKKVHDTGIITWKLPDGRLHREDGPAIITLDGRKMWLINDELHREDGPAVEFQDGDKQWWLNNKSYRGLDEWAVELGIYGTDEHTMMKLKWG